MLHRHLIIKLYDKFRISLIRKSNMAKSYAYNILSCKDVTDDAIAPEVYCL